MSRRQRADGTWTFADEAYDRAWYWPAGTRVIIAGTAAGVVVKENSVSVRVRLDDGRELPRVPKTHPELQRAAGAVEA